MKTYHELLELCFVAREMGIDIFFNYSPHVEWVDIDIHKGKWSEDNPHPYKSFRIFTGEGYEDCKCGPKLALQAINYINKLLNKPDTCMGCYRFEPKGGNLGYCEIQDHIISIEMGCEEWEPADV